jgi:hypothetical protein
MRCYRGDGDLMARPLDFELLHIVKEGEGKRASVWQARSCMSCSWSGIGRRRCRMAVRDDGHWRRLPRLLEVRDNPCWVVSGPKGHWVGSYGE